MTSGLPGRPADHPPIASRKVGVLLVNLGTPDAPTPAAVKRYLAEFLSDRRVVEIPPLVWQPILRGIILNTRPKKSAHAYQQVWTSEGSPLAAHTRAAAERLGAVLAGEGVLVDWAMRYGNPSIASKLAAMKAAGCERILFAPLYPHYSGATTASAMDGLGAALKAMRWQPAIRTLPPYYDHPAYIGALAADARRHLAQLGAKPDALLLTFHGMPERTLHLGDPYHCHCVKTARLLAEALENDIAGPIEMSFQSRFGRAKWLEPSTEHKLAELAQRGVKTLAVMAPGFSADCLETLEEIALRGRDIFLAHMGETLVYLPCLNAGDEAISFYGRLLRDELGGWI
ncbi:MAG: ferrochelatase [Sphingobium sp.]|jgi:ferrochelatase|nr:ferrochelatase [Sphingobium sp.]MCI1270956.1 ferrochelatase [Sphingobium sp.]MCI1757013.1 ferrochelatase [Sphingobium sp.]MCI2052510.1 ferrochelatase [Sphingobium sp.]